MCYQKVNFVLVNNIIFTVCMALFQSSVHMSKQNKEQLWKQISDSTQSRCSLKIKENKKKTLSFHSLVPFIESIPVAFLTFFR